MPETKQYGIIYADPPWHYDRKHGSGVAENHYPTMSIENPYIRCRKLPPWYHQSKALPLWLSVPQCR